MDSEIFEQNIVWEDMQGDNFRFKAQVDNVEYKIRINMEPCAPIFTLFRNNGQLDSFDDWPDTWVMPKLKNGFSFNKIKTTKEDINDDPYNQREIYFKEIIPWAPTNNPEFPFKSYIDNMKYTIRINDWPDNAMYTFLENDKELFSFDDWPNNWEMPQKSNCILI